MIGKAAEDFTLPDQDGNEFNLYKNLNNKILLIFYPNDDTPICSSQLSNYEMNKELFLKKGIDLVAINYDTPESHKKFCKKIDINFPLLSDDAKTTAKKFNAVNFLGMIKRKAILIDTDKKIIFEKKMLSISFTTSKDLIEEMESLKLI